MNPILSYTMVVMTTFLVATAPCGASENAPSLAQLQQQAEQGNAEAQVKLGLIFRRGREVSQNYSQARHWFHKAARQGDADGQYNLGLMYDYGRGVERHFVQARTWYRMAAEQGHANAQYNLALLYANGQGVPRDDVEAYAWANVAAAQKHFAPAIELRDRLLKTLGSDCHSKARQQSKIYFEKYVVPFQ